MFCARVDVNVSKVLTPTTKTKRDLCKETAQMVQVGGNRREDGVLSSCTSNDTSLSLLRPSEVFLPEMYRNIFRSILKSVVLTLEGARERFGR